MCGTISSPRINPLRNNPSACNSGTSTATFNGYLESPLVQFDQYRILPKPGLPGFYEQGCFAFQITEPLQRRLFVTKSPLLQKHPFYKIAHIWKMMNWGRRME
jgi:hypothetical protein